MYHRYLITFVIIQGLGATVEPLKCLLREQPVSKTQFTMLVGDVEHRLDSLQRQKPIDTVILAGLETHVCIIATCIDLIHRGLNVSHQNGYLLETLDRF